MNKLILVVDDEEAIRIILSEFLTGSGYRVVAASNPVETRQAIQKEVPQLMVCDLQLEQSDGLSMIASLKPLIPSTPVMLLTGMLFDSATAEELTRQSISSYLPKTSPLTKIISEVHRLIGPP